MDENIAPDVESKENIAPDVTPKTQRPYPLDRDSAELSPLTDEHLSFIIYHTHDGLAPAQVTDLLNSTFSLTQDVQTVEEAISYIKFHDRRAGWLRAEAGLYPWCHPRHQVTRIAPQVIRGLMSKPLFTVEMKAFVLWKYQAGYLPQHVLRTLNERFGTKHELQTMKSMLSHVLHNESTVAHLKTVVERFEWWEPTPPARIEKMEKRTAAKLRIAKKSREYKNWKKEERIRELEEEEART